MFSSLFTVWCSLVGCHISCTWFNVLEQTFFFFQTKIKPSLKIHPLFLESIVYINAAAGKGNFISPRLKALGTLGASFREERIKWELSEKDFCCSLPWKITVYVVFKVGYRKKKNTHRFILNFPVSVEYNFINRKPRLGNWLAANLGLDLRSSDPQFSSLPATSDSLLWQPQTQTASVRSARKAFAPLKDEV